MHFKIYLANTSSPPKTKTHTTKTNKTAALSGRVRYPRGGYALGEAKKIPIGRRFHN